MADTYCFDPGFSHEYPQEMGLIEELLEDERVLIEVQNEDDQPVPQNDTLFFPCRIEDGYNYYVLPPGSRDLTSYLRLIKHDSDAVNAGQLLGLRISQIHQELGCIPSDSVTRRFSVVWGSGSLAARFGGLDMKMLPPYKNMDANIGDLERILRLDLERQRDELSIDPAILFNAVVNGSRYVS